LQSCIEDEHDPQEIADDLLKDAITLDRGRPVDDISVVVIHVSVQNGDSVRRMMVRLPID
jgi:serine phosphatase RsbU (regulator of sigma subunit)